MGTADATMAKAPVVAEDMQEPRWGATKFKLTKHMEKVIVISVLLGSVLGVFLIDEKAVLLNFYYIPVLVAGYFLGKKHAVLAAIFCVLAVIFYAVLYPEIFANDQKTLVRMFSLLSAWGGFLVLVAIISSYLYELNQQRIRDLREAYVGVLEILTKYLEDKDTVTKGHSLRVAEMARDTARAMRLSDEQVETVRVAAMLHDIGKVEISTSLISKAASLTDEERLKMESHVEKGENILKSVGTVLKDAVPLVVAHHRYYSAGVAAGTKSEGLSHMPLGARIIAVADAFDAMTTDRPYRKAMPFWDALKELKANAGTQFDPNVVQVFENVVAARAERM